jgi:hypothetical protein
MSVLWLLLAIAILLIAASPAPCLALLEKLFPKRTVSVAYWGLYEGQSGTGLEESIELPQPGRKLITPAGGTSYSNGKPIIT